MGRMRARVSWGEKSANGKMCICKACNVKEGAVDEKNQGRRPSDLSICMLRKFVSGYPVCRPRFDPSDPGRWTGVITG